MIIVNEWDLSIFEKEVTVASIIIEMVLAKKWTLKKIFCQF